MNYYYHNMNCYIMFIMSCSLDHNNVMIAIITGLMSINTIQYNTIKCPGYCFQVTLNTVICSQDKVANVWCSLSIFVKLKNLDQAHLIKMW